MKLSPSRGFLLFKTRSSIFSICLPCVASTSTLPGCDCTASGTAMYDFTFNPDWTDPAPLPSSHWSWPIGAAHSPCVTFWKNQGMATPGVQSIAETGNTATFAAEISAMGKGALESFQGGLIFAPTGSTLATFKADRYHSLVSALSMIAPSPDWFVGVDSLNLCNGSQWVQRVEVPLFPWDAGTDSGLTFDALNSVTSPQQPIERITATSTNTDSFQKSSGSTSSLGTFVFELSSVDHSATVTDAECAQCPVDMTTRMTSQPMTTPPVTTQQMTTQPSTTEVPGKSIEFSTALFMI